MTSTWPAVQYTFNAVGQITSLQQGTVTSASSFTAFAPTVISNSAYDTLGRLLSSSLMSGTTPQTLTYAYDAAGNRTGVTWPDTSNPLTANYVYDPLNHVTQIEQNGATSGSGLLAVYSYDGVGRRTGISRAGGAGLATSYGYDAISRLSSLTQTLNSAAGTTFTYGYNPANQVISRADSNGGFTVRPSAISSTYTANGLNQYSAVTGVEQTVAAGPQATLTYDPLGRIQAETSSGVTSNFLYDGAFLAEEYTASGATTARYIPGPGTDEPIVVYSGATLSAPNWYAADEEGSIIATADASANDTASYAYGPYGEPVTSAGAPAWGGARYRYTGQIEIPGALSYFYKARMYDPSQGRFFQTDPAGFGGGVNIYAYVMDDPINGWDPSGLEGCGEIGDTIVTTPDGTTYVLPGESLDCPRSHFGIGPIVGGLGGNGPAGENNRGQNPKPQNTQQCSSGPARQYGISYSGNLFGILGGASLSVTIGVSIPTSGAGAQAFVGGEFDPLVGLGVNGGTSIGPTFGHSPTAVETGFNPTGSHIEGGAGLAYGAGVAQTVLPDGSVSTSIGFSGPPLPALKAGAYVGAGPAYSGQVATPQLGCHKS